MKWACFFILCLSTLPSGAQSSGELSKQAKELLTAQKYTDAIDICNQLIARDSLNYEYFSIKAECQLKLGNYVGSRENYSRAIALSPSTTYLYLQRGNVLLTTGHFDDAIADFTTSYEKDVADSSRRMDLCNRAAAKIMKRDFTGAYDDLRSAYRLDSNDISVLNNLSAVCDDAGHDDETIGYLNKILRIDSNYSGAYSNLGFKYQGMGQHEKAISYFNKVLTLTPDEPLAFSNRSFSRLKIGDVEGAMKDIDHSLELYPTNAYAYKIRALIFIRMDNMARACLDIQTALDQGYTTTWGDEVLDLKKKYCGN